MTRTAAAGSVMSRLVVVSNRLADPRKTTAGGLAVALADVLNNTGGLWFGWSGKIVEASDGGKAGEGEVRSSQGGRRSSWSPWI